MGFLLSYWRWIVIGLLAAALGWQTVRLARSEQAYAVQKAEISAFDADLAQKRLEGFQEGVRQQNEAQARLDKAKADVVAGLKADADRRVADAEGRAARLKAALALQGDKFQCLDIALPEDVLKEYRK